MGGGVTAFYFTDGELITEAKILNSVVLDISTSSFPQIDDMPPSETNSKAESPDNWKSDSSDHNSQEGAKVFVPELLPVPNLSRPNDSLCDTCKSLNLAPRRFVVFPEDDVDENTDEDSINLGLVRDIKNKSHCPFCRLVLKAEFKNEVVEVEDGEPVEMLISWRTNGPIPDPTKPWKHIPQIRVLRTYTQKVGGGDTSTDKLNIFPEITLLANDAPTPSKSFFARLIKDEIDFNMVKNWLNMCTGGHGEHCNQSRMLNNQIQDPATEIPSFRVVDVIDNCIIPAPPKCKYVALSYVWGTINISTILRLLKANHEELRKPGALLQGECLMKIPVTIRDAMEVVRRIGLRYLWTDSLCIVQDDEDTAGSRKVACISRMDLVYGTAFVTIIAATGSDANAGLPGTYAGTRGKSQPIEEISPGFRLAFKPREEDNIPSSIHSTRAWTFQERMFSRRTLTFIDGQVVFACRKAAEWREDLVFEDRHETAEGVIGNTSDYDPDEIGQFEGLIQTYTRLSLTKRSDIYHAFAGLTRYINTQLDATLCHGIPDRYFDWFLLWDAIEKQTRHPDAPSWSWSGWNGESCPHIWDWHNRSIAEVQVALQKRTWVIWYQRKAHDSEDCVRIWTPKTEIASHGDGRRNFYGGPVTNRFSFDCTRTEPTRRLLVGAPEYIHDTHNPTPGSGYLQFWTVSAMFKLNEAISPTPELTDENFGTRLGIFGDSNSKELGIIFVDPEWCKKNPMPKAYEFILICEGRDERAKKKRFDDEIGWRYMVMLIEWHGEWAERVAIGWIKKRYLKKAIGSGAVWKEIVLG